MTRGGWLRGILWGSNGGGGIRGGAVTRRGLIRPKPMMTRVCKTPPGKKIPKKIFRRSNFFFKKKNFLVWGFSVIMGFSFKTKPVSSWVFGTWLPCHHGFPPNPRCREGSWGTPGRLHWGQSGSSRGGQAWYGGARRRSRGVRVVTRGVWRKPMMTRGGPVDQKPTMTRVWF